MSAEVQESGGKWKEQTEKVCRAGGFHSDGGYEYVADYFLYALYHPEQASDDGDKHAE